MVMALISYKDNAFFPVTRIIQYAIRYVKGML